MITEICGTSPAMATWSAKICASQLSAERARGKRGVLDEGEHGTSADPHRSADDPVAGEGLVAQALGGRLRPDDLKRALVAE